MYLKQYSEVLLSYCRRGLQVLCILVVPDVWLCWGVSGSSEQAQVNFFVCYCSPETWGTFSTWVALLFPWIILHLPAHTSNPSSPRRKRPPESCLCKCSCNPAPEVMTPGLLALINLNEFLLCITGAPTESVRDPRATRISGNRFQSCSRKQFIPTILLDPEDLCK